MAPFHTEFPDFLEADWPTMPPVGDFVDVSWRNDMCPSIASDRLQLQVWIDFLNPTDREFFDSPRFRVEPQICGIEATGESLETDDWAEVLAFIAKRAEACQ